MEEKITDLFLRHNHYSEKEILEWNALEDMLSVFCHLDGDEILDEAYGNAENDYERASYFDSPAWNVAYYTDYIAVLKEKFVEWISQIDTNIIRDGYFAPEREDFILTFNYTDTIEKNYLIDKSNILHIHGEAGKKVIIGHNEYQEPSLFDISGDPDLEYRDYLALEEVNSVLQKAAKIFFKDSEKIIETNIDFFEKIKACEKVVFIGLSCGKQDQIYVRNIISRAKCVDFFGMIKKLNRI